MQAVLNFGKNSKQKIISFLESYPSEATKEKFEEKRAKIGESTVTLYDSGKLVLQGKDCEKVKEMLLEALGEKGETILGIDETGRGELNGPFVVCGVLGTEGKLRELRDSKKTKKISEKQGTIEKNAKAIASFSFSPEFIDEAREKGITMNELQAAAVDGIAQSFRRLDKKTRVVVDGNVIKEVKENAEFLPKADDLNPVVGAASVKAKFLRDTSANKQKRKTWKNA